MQRGKLFTRYWGGYDTSAIWCGSMRTRLVWGFGDGCGETQWVAVRMASGPGTFGYKLGLGRRRDKKTSSSLRGAFVC